MVVLEVDVLDVDVEVHSAGAASSAGQCGARSVVDSGGVEVDRPCIWFVKWWAVSTQLLAVQILRQCRQWNEAVNELRRTADCVVE
eukprot:6491903-Amphidinium_carterae.2